jgi:hypothetical protein
MSTKTRYFLIGSVLVLVVGLSVGLVAYYGGFPGLALGQGSGPDELRFVPRDASVVAYVNVREVMGSDFRKKLLTMEPAGAEKGQQEFRDATGINIETDIDSVLAYLGAGGTANGVHEGVVLARGTFNEPKIRAFLTEKGAKQEAYNGKTIFVPAEPGKSAPAGLVFLENGLAAVGSMDSLKKTIDAFKTGGAGNVLDNTELMKLVDSVRGHNNAWAVGRFDAVTGQAKLPAQVASQIPDISYFAASGHINGGVSCNLSMQAKDDEAARNLNKVIEGFIALAQMQMGGQKGDLQGIFKSLNLQTSSDGNKVAISFSASSDLLDAVGRLAKGAREPQAPKSPEPPQPPQR